MSKDLLDSLGEIGRQARQDDDPRLESLLRGELSAEEVAELERAAEADPELASKLELYRPLEEEARARIADRILESAPQGPALRAEVAAPAKVLPWRRVATVLVPVAAAAALMLWLMQPARIAPLPDYAAVVEGGDSALRSDPGQAPATGPVKLAPGSRLTLVLRPATDVEGPLEARFFAHQGDVFERLSLKSERAESGALRASGTASELFGARRGQWQLVVLVGRPAALERHLQAKLSGPEPRGVGWQRVSVEVLLTDQR